MPGDDVPFVPSRPRLNSLLVVLVERRGLAMGISPRCWYCRRKDSSRHTRARSGLLLLGRERKGDDNLDGLLLLMSTLFKSSRAISPSGSEFVVIMSKSGSESIPTKKVRVEEMSALDSPRFDGDGQILLS